MCARHWASWSAPYIIHAGQVLTHGLPSQIVENPDVRRLYLGRELFALSLSARRPRPFHLIEQPMEGCCSRGPSPDRAIFTIAS